MRITTLIIGIQTYCAAMALADSTKAQNISIDVKQVSVTKIFKEIEKQANVTFTYNENTIKGLTGISIKIVNTPLTVALKEIEKITPLQFKQQGNLIGVLRKAPDVQQQVINNSEHLLLQPIPEVTYLPQTLQRNISGTVTDTAGTPVSGATVKLTGSAISAITNNKGYFAFPNVPNEGTITVSYIGYKTEQISFNTNTSFPISVILHSSSAGLKEVTIVSTGYQEIPKERVTGSFDQIDNTLINRSVSTNILDRLDGIASGLRFNGAALKAVNVNGYVPGDLGINVRGQSTLITSTDPLIVVDNFPYDGEISNINPNDVESITVLKDAAAASIWGANSSNGVIVITTKQGRLNQKMQVALNANVTIGNKPDLFYDKNFLNSSDYIDVEKYLFNQGYFDGTLSDTYSYPAISPVVNILAMQRSGTISQAQADNQIDALRKIDVRNDFDKYVYQKSVNQQYSLGIRGGGKDLTYALSVGHDDNADNLIRNGFTRTTIKSQNSYIPIKNLELTAGLNYSQSTTLSNNAYGYGDLTAYSMGNSQYNTLYPYAQLADEHGNALAIPKNYSSAYINSTQGLLDWNFRPLDEINNADNTTKVNDLLLNFTARYQIIPQLNAQILYENEHQVVNVRNLQSQQTYFTRNLINQFTEVDPATGIPNYIFPLGGILNLTNGDWASNNVRGQLNYSQTIKKNNIIAIAGAEIREKKVDGYATSFYGYDNNFGTADGYLNYNTAYDTNPSGSSYLPAPPSGTTEAIYRYISYFANAAYTFDDKYVFNISGRKDGANIFGAKTNDRITPLWSAGLGWNISKEKSYHVSWLPYLRLRATYGFNGNVYLGSAYLAGVYTTAGVTGANAIAINEPPNPELRWERVKNINIGIDFGTKDDRLTGTIEVYRKDGEDLLEPTPLAPQTGFSTYIANTANTSTNGVDVTLQSRNLVGALKWNTTLLLSTQHDKLLHFDVAPTSETLLNGIGYTGYPLYSVFSYKWAGLDPTNGDPQGYLNGKISKDYTGIFNNYKPDSLVYNGSSRPTIYGSLRNDFSFKGFSLSFNIKYELGYVFRRASVTGNYTDILTYFANADYTNRWQKPGDELHTNVPSFIYPGDSQRATFYTFSQALVQNANNIRLQDVRLSYTVPKLWLAKSPVKSLQLYTYADNIGIIWRANKYGIDPDAYGGSGTHTLPIPFTISFGLNANF